MYTRPTALFFFVILVGIVPVYVHEVDRKDAEQIVQ